MGTDKYDHRNLAFYPYLSFSETSVYDNVFIINGKQARLQRAIEKNPFIRSMIPSKQPKAFFRLLSVKQS